MTGERTLIQVRNQVLMLRTKNHRSTGGAGRPRPATMQRWFSPTPCYYYFSSLPVLLEVFAYVYFCLSIPWLLGVTSQNKQKSHPCFYRKWSPRCSDPLCHTAHVCRRMTLKLWLYAVFVPSLVLTSFSVFNMGGKGKQNPHKLPDKFLWKEYKLL